MSKFYVHILLIFKTEINNQTTFFYNKVKGYFLRQRINAVVAPIMQSLLNMHYEAVVALMHRDLTTKNKITQYLLKAPFRTWFSFLLVKKLKEK